MQIAVAYFFFNAHWVQVTGNLSDSVAADISVTVDLFKQSPSIERADRLDAMMRPHMELSVALEPDDELPSQTRNAFFSTLDKTLQRALTQSLTDPFWFDTTRYPNHIDIRVAVDEGVLRFIAARERVFAPTGFVFIFWLVTATLLLTLVSILFIRNQAKPIAKLAAAAEAFGKGEDTKDFKPSGASEVRLAGQAFIKMRQRIKRHIEQRASLLAGVSHDLRTPLTRLNLHLALQDDSTENKAARRDLKDMESMLEGYLNFAHGLQDETSKTRDAADFVKDVVMAFNQNDIDVSVISTASVSIKPISLKRALSNILSNALKYGDKARITIRAQRDAVELNVDDDGPGIPPDQYEQVFQPFHRLDEARNQNIEGVGLGLSIAQDIIQQHGGTVTLSESDWGGLAVKVRIPR